MQIPGFFSFVAERFRRDHSLVPDRRRGDGPTTPALDIAPGHLLPLPLRVDVLRDPHDRVPRRVAGLHRRRVVAAVGGPAPEQRAAEVVPVGQRRLERREHDVVVGRLVPGPVGLLAKLLEQQRLAQLARLLDVRVDPDGREREVGGVPVVGPHVDRGEVDRGRGVLGGEVWLKVAVGWNGGGSGGGRERREKNVSSSLFFFFSLGVEKRGRHTAGA